MSAAASQQEGCAFDSTPPCLRGFSAGSSHTPNTWTLGLIGNSELTEGVNAVCSAVIRWWIDGRRRVLTGTGHFLLPECFTICGCFHCAEIKLDPGASHLGDKYTRPISKYAQTLLASRPGLGVVPAKFSTKLPRAAKEFFFFFMASANLF